LIPIRCPVAQTCNHDSTPARLGGTHRP
jgi:hypothetical protein